MISNKIIAKESFMELVYLWVEDYKNIQKQGFNFSPRFMCEYDEDTKELKIVDKDETGEFYPKNFFGDNINVTAIVGENGSGKSTLIELISFFRFERIQRLLTNKKMIIIYRINNIFYIPEVKSNGIHLFKSANIQLVNLTKLKIYSKTISSEEQLFDITMFSNDLSNITDQTEYHESLKSDHYDSFYNGFNILYGKDLRDDKINQKEFNAKYMYIFSQNEKFFDFLNEKFLFSKMRIELDLNKITRFNYMDSEDKEYFQDIELFFYDLNGTISEDMQKYNKNDRYKNKFVKIQKEYLIYKLFAYLIIKEYYSLISHFQNEFNEKFKDEMLTKVFEKINIDINRFYEIEKAQKMNLFQSRSLKMVIFIQIIKKINDYMITINELLTDEFKDKKGWLDEFLYYKNKFKYFKYYKKSIPILSKLFKLIDINNEEKLLTEISDISSTTINYYYKRIKQNKILFDLNSFGFFYINFLHRDNELYSFRNLSTGEKAFLKFLVNFVYTINNMQYSKNSLIFFDEIECSYHPKWQQKIFHIILNIINKKLFIKKSTNWHLIFLTHSPFLLSDIPKSNVLFLEEGCEHNKELEMETFGANIHTLLSQGFFMNDGLMGEFAKDKIQSIIKYHEDIEKKEIIEADKIEFKTKKQKEFWQIQSIIGDDYLKQVIKNHLIEIEKIVLGNDEARKEEVKRLKAQIELLEK